MPLQSCTWGHQARVWPQEHVKLLSKNSDIVKECLVVLWPCVLVSVSSSAPVLQPTQAVSRDGVGEEASMYVHARRLHQGVLLQDMLQGICHRHTHTHTQYTSFTYNQESSVKTADALHNRKEALRERTRTQLPQKKAKFPSISVQDSVRRARTPSVPCIWYASELHLRGKVQEHPACWRTAPLLSSVRFLRSSDTNAWVLCRILKGLWNTASVSYFTSSTSTSRRDLRVSGRSMQRFTQSYQSKRLQLTHQDVSYCVRTHLIQGLVAGMKGKKLDTWKRLLIFRALTL